MTADQPAEGSQAPARRPGDGGLAPLEDAPGARFKARALPSGP